MRFFIACLLALLVTNTATAMDGNQCTKQGGTIVNRLGPTKGCSSGKNIGKIDGMRCPCICCVGEKIIDCRKNPITLTHICDAGDALHATLSFAGPETPEHIYITLDSESYNHMVDLEIPAGANGRKLVMPYEKYAKNKKYTSIPSYRVEYLNTPLSDCSFPIEATQPALKILPCPKP